MSLVIPVKAGHVAAAYREASADPDAFRKTEMQWLLDNHPLLRTGLMSAYGVNMAQAGPDLGTPYLLGSTIGHRVVRLCAEGTGDYETARTNYRHNMDIAAHLQTTGPWNDVETLDRVFGDHDVSEAMMVIRHDITRAAAASVIGFLCLDEIPDVPTMQLAYGQL